MGTSNRPGHRPGANIDRMMDRLGIDGRCSVAPEFGLAFSCALRSCSVCVAHEKCADWLAQESGLLSAPPDFCPNLAVLWDLLCDPAFGYHAHSVH